LRMTTTLRGVAPNSEDFRAGWDLFMEGTGLAELKATSIT
jgi:hypothetical protein